MTTAFARSASSALLSLATRWSSSAFSASRAARSYTTGHHPGQPKLNSGHGSCESPAYRDGLFVIQLPGHALSLRGADATAGGDAVTRER
jgi:hypothetical protein